VSQISSKKTQYANHVVNSSTHSVPNAKIAQPATNVTLDFTISIDNALTVRQKTHFAWSVMQQAAIDACRTSLFQTDNAHHASSFRAVLKANVQQRLAALSVCQGTT